MYSTVTTTHSKESKASDRCDFENKRVRKSTLYKPTDVINTNNDEAFGVSEILSKLWPSRVRCWQTDSTFERWSTERLNYSQAMMYLSDSRSLETDYMAWELLTLGRANPLYLWSTPVACPGLRLVTGPKETERQELNKRRMTATANCQYGDQHEPRMSSGRGSGETFPKGTAPQQTLVNFRPSTWWPTSSTKINIACPAHFFQRSNEVNWVLRQRWLCYVITTPLTHVMHGHLEDKIRHVDCAICHEIWLY